MGERKTAGEVLVERATGFSLSFSFKFDSSRLARDTFQTIRGTFTDKAPLIGHITNLIILFVTFGEFPVSSSDSL